MPVTHIWGRASTAPPTLFQAQLSHTHPAGAQEGGLASATVSSPVNNTHSLPGRCRRFTLQVSKVFTRPLHQREPLIIGDWEFPDSPSAVTPSEAQTAAAAAEPQLLISLLCMGESVNAQPPCFWRAEKSAAVESASEQVEQAFSPSRHLSDKDAQCH